MSCHPRWAPLLLDAAYGEIGSEDAGKLEAHLQQCEVCTEELESLKTTLSLANEAMPAPLESLDIWSKIDHRVNTPRRWRLQLGPAGTAFAAAALVVIGMGLGRLLQLPTEPTPDAATPVFSSHVAMDYAQFLDRATPVLLAVANRDADLPVTDLVGFDPSAEQRAAANLATSAQSLSIQLRDAGMQREARLADNLALVFMQMANLPSDAYPASLQLVQTTIDQQALLFQLSVEELRRSSNGV
ncbi:MAG: hypothetical protein DHS20C11_22300 [Lysobacteraceae bacterium]|nr:MAG: hypothetical protein DHS20C11_22300 [Xanthomonadaceae bacterium]